MLPVQHRVYTSCSSSTYLNDSLTIVVGLGVNDDLEFHALGHHNFLQGCNAVNDCSENGIRNAHP